MNRHKIITALFAFACGLYSFCVVAGFAKYVPISVSGYSGTALANFPVLVKISEEKIPNVYSVVKHAGTDLKFTDGSGEGEYPYEVDTWNPSGTSYVWVKLPSFAAGVNFRMYYGDRDKTTNPGSAQVWSDYAGVWHLNEAVDSADKDYKPEDGTTHTTRFYDCARVISEGVIGKGLGSTRGVGAAFASQVYDDRNGHKCPIQVTNPSKFTVSCWVRVQDVVAWSDLFGPVNQNGGNTGWKAEWTAAGGEKMRLCQCGGAGERLNYFNTPTLASGWHKLDAIWDGASLILYIDGAKLGEKTNCPGDPVWFYTGWMGWGGCINGDGTLGKVTNTTQNCPSGTDFDECRIYDGVKSADSIAADYAIETRSDIFTIGAPQSGYDTHKNRLMDVSDTEQIAVFCEPGTYTWTAPVNPVDNSVDILVVGGGGGGGGNAGGGGGGGEVIHREELTLVPGCIYTITVGAGGVAGGNLGGSGGDSSMYQLGTETGYLAKGGGPGSGGWDVYNSGIALSGANGGGAGGNGSSVKDGGPATVAEGHAGGKSGSYRGGGGGGMAEAGHDATADVEKSYGGAGVSCDITGDSKMYGYGGAGYAGDGVTSLGGARDGYGNAWKSATDVPTAGEDGTGGGGGGGQGNNGNAVGGAGGSGTVIIRYSYLTAPVGTVSIAKVDDAKEQGLVPGHFRVTCSSNLKEYNVVVRYTVGGTAVAGRTYETLSGSVLIPKGATTADIAVTPLTDKVMDRDSTVVVTIAEDPSYTISGSASATLTVVEEPANTRYVSTSGSDSNDGLSAGTAFATLNKALAELAPDGGLIYVAPGEYTTSMSFHTSLNGPEDEHGNQYGLWFSNYLVTNAVRIVGSGARPDDVVFKWVAADSPFYEIWNDNKKRWDTDQKPNPRIFYINHPAAKLKNLTIRGGRLGVPNGPVRCQECGGSNIFIDTEGGTVEDCLIDDGKIMETWGVGGGGVQMYGGKLIRCRITNCVQGGQYAQYAPDTGYNIGSAIYMTGGVVENTLMVGNGIQYSGCTVMIRGAGKLLNCTIAGNTGLQCAGVAVQHADAEVHNCAIFNNTCHSDSSGFGHVFAGKYGSGTDDEKKSHDRLATRFFNCAADTFVNESCIEAANGGFVDQASSDYHLGTSSCCRDSAFGYQECGTESETDLDGKPRKMGEREDIGCYEYDPTILACDFYADKTETLYRDDLGGTWFNFTAIVEGVYTGPLTYEWDFDGNGEYEVSTPNAKYGRGYTDPNLGGTGYYTVGLKVTAASGEVAYARKLNYIHLAPQHIYVRTDSTGGAFPYRADIPEKAAPDLFTALTAAISGTTIHIGAGEYVWNGSNRPDVNIGVKILGATSDPKDTVIRYSKSSNNSNCMLLKVNHPDAFVANITWQDGFVYNDGAKMPACGIHVTGNGGTISNCVIKGCSASQTQNGSGVGGIRMEAGLLTHCILDDNRMYNVDAANCYSGNANSRKAQGLYATGPSRIENCLFRNMNTDNCLIVLGADSKNEEPVMRNCTVVNCSFDFWTDNPGSNTYRMQWPCSAIECILGKGKVYNTVISNTRRRAWHHNNSGVDYPEEIYAHFTRNSRYPTMDGGTTSADLDTDARCCTKCATDSIVPINSSCVVMSSDDFEDYAAGNFVPKLGGAIQDAGQSVPGWSGILDLAGFGRVSGRRIDIGCYEQQKGDAGGVKIYVDCNYDDSMGPSDGSMECPWKTIKEGCDVAESTNSYIYVRGGTDRVYTFNDYRDAATLIADTVYLIGCDDDWNPATGYTDPEAMVTLAISDTYADTSKTVANADSFAAPINVRGANCRVSGFRSEFTANSFRSYYRKDNQTINIGDGLINVFGSGSIVENCWFKGPKTLIGNQYASSKGIIYGGATGDGYQTKNVVIRNCYFYVPNSNSACAFYSFLDGTRFENCLVENVASLYLSGNQVSDINYYIISNIFLNCPSSAGRQLLGNANNSTPGGGEIAYNRAIHNNGEPGYYVFVQHGAQYGNNWYKPTYIHHNTIVGYDFAFMKQYYGSSASSEASRRSGADPNCAYQWTPNIFDNLLVDVKTNIWECATGMFSGNTVSSFKPGSTFYNNALYNTEFLGGPATTFSWYDLKDLTGTNTTITVDTNPPFVNTTDPLSENYYRLKVPQAPWVIDAWVGDDPSFPDPNIPRYIGAVEPQPGGFAVRIR